MLVQVYVLDLLNCLCDLVLEMLWQTLQYCNEAVKTLAATKARVMIARLLDVELRVCHDMYRIRHIEL